MQEVYAPFSQSYAVKLKPWQYERLGAVTGESCRTVVLTIFALSSPKALEAELDARTQAPGADLILNKHVYQGGETIVPGIYTRRCVFLEGEAIRLATKGRP